MKRYKIVNKFRFFTAMSLIGILLFASMFLIIVNAKSINSEILVPVYVSEGDSLWELAARYSDGNLDIRHYIDKVISINKLESANIHPGELLMFPQQAK